MDNVVLRLNTVRKLKELSSNKKIICYGAGKLADEFLAKEYVTVSDIAFFVDTYKKGEKDEIGIYEPLYLKNCKSGDFFIVVTSSYVAEILEILNGMIASDGKAWEVLVFPLKDEIKKRGGIDLIREESFLYNLNRYRG